MKKRLMMTVLIVALFAAVALAADAKKDKNETCALIGNCGNDMVTAAKSMQVECEKMIAKGKELIEKGKMIRGQGALWQDKAMEADGQTLYDQGKAMYDEAKAMHNTCALIIAQGEKTKKKYSGYHSKKDEKPEPQLPGDHN